MSLELDMAIAKVECLQEKALGTFTAKELSEFWLELDFELYGINKYLKLVRDNETEK